MVDAVQAATTLEEEKRLVKECRYAHDKEARGLYGVLEVPQFYFAVQPWVIGYNGEVDSVNNLWGQDLLYPLRPSTGSTSELKKEMGH